MKKVLLALCVLNFGLCYGGGNQSVPVQESRLPEIKLPDSMGQNEEHRRQLIDILSVLLARKDGCVYSRVMPQFKITKVIHYKKGEENGLEKVYAKPIPVVLLDRDISVFDDVDGPGLRACDVSAAMLLNFYEGYTGADDIANIVHCLGHGGIVKSEQGTFTVQPLIRKRLCDEKSN